MTPEVANNEQKDAMSTKKNGKIDSTFPPRAWKRTTRQSLRHRPITKWFDERVPNGIEYLSCQEHEAAMAEKDKDIGKLTEQVGGGLIKIALDGSVYTMLVEAEKRLSAAEALLRECVDLLERTDLAIDALAASQKVVGMGLLGKGIVAPATKNEIGKMLAKLRERKK